MPRPTVDDPLVPLTIRVPASLRADLERQAAAAGVSTSDALRSHLTLVAAKPLGKPTPRRRQPSELGRVSGTDPQVLRQVAGVGNSLHLIARGLHAAAADGGQFDLVQVLAELSVMLRDLARIADAADGSAGRPGGAV